MSLVSALLTMRAAVSRGPGAVDSYGLTTPRLKDYQPIADGVPCYVWIRQGTQFVDGKSVNVEEMRAYFRKDADVKRLDVLTQVTNRNGDVIYAGPIVIDTLDPKAIGAVVSHIEGGLRRHLGA